MSICVKKIDSRTYVVNKKTVVYNMDNKWESDIPLTETEKQVFFNILKADYYEKKSRSKMKLSALADDEINSLNKKIDNIKTQRRILDDNGDPFSEEKLKLRNYYENKLQSYIKRRDALIKDLPIRDADIVSKS